MMGTLTLVAMVTVISGAVASPMVDLQPSQPLTTVQSLWENFQADYNKTYESQLEKDLRSKIFESNVKYITQHNELYSKGEKSYYLGINQFTDLTHQEFLQMYTSEIKPITNDNATTYLPPLNAELPTTVDWRTKGYVSKVKNQGQCGSCWAFSVTGAIEGQHFRKTNRLISLSEQQLVDCSKRNSGCNGGIMPVAMKYVKDNGGIEGETDYPYIAKDSTCKFRKSLVRATVSGVVIVSKGSETALQNAVSNVGPISVGIDASHRSFQSYTGGVYNEPSCSSSHLDHGVLVVGYGISPSSYWLVKNSWGTSWGERGYIRMSRNKNNQCGIATGASYPTV